MIKNLFFSLWLMLTCLLTTSVFGQGNETFSNLPPLNSSSYANRSWIGDDEVTWTATNARTDQTITGMAIATNNTGSVKSPSYSNGMGRLKFKYSRAFTGTTTRSIEVYVNNVKKGNTITVNPSSNDIIEYNQDINVEGNVVLELRTSGGQIKIDDISWTFYQAPALTAPVITPNQTITGTYGVALSNTARVNVTGNVTEWLTVSGTLPSGISFNNVSGVFTGTPTQAGNFPLVFKASNAVGESVPETVTLTIAKANQTISGLVNLNKYVGDPEVVLPSVTNANNTITYTSSNPSAVTVEGNRLNFVGEGVATITATSIATETHNGFSTTFTATVTKKNQTVTGLSNLSKYVGDTEVVLPAVTNENNAITYTSSNPSAVTVEGNRLNFVGAGNATITATSAATETHNGFSTTFTVTVTKQNQTVTGLGNLRKFIGEEAITLTAHTAQGQTITYESSNNNIALVTGNILSFVGAGSATITARAASTDIYNALEEVSFNVVVVDPNAIPCFEDDFSLITSGHSNSTSGSNSAWNGNANFPSVSSVYQAGGAIKLGSGNNIGSITTKELQGLSGKLQISFDVKSWTNKEGDIKVSVVGTDLSEVVTFDALMADGFENKSITLNNVPANAKITFATTSKRAFLDNISICQLDESTTWNGTAWSNGEPTASIKAILEGNPTTNFTAKQVLVKGTNIVTIPTGITITVAENIVVDETASLTLANGASVIQNNATAVNVGHVKVQSNYNKSVKRLDMMLWASPVANQTILTVSPLTLANRFVRYNEYPDGFQIVASPATEVFEPGKMIGFRTPNNFTETATAFTAKYDGVLNNGTIHVPVTKQMNGFNGVGNPYPSKLNLEALIAANSSLGINRIFFWANNGSTSTSGDNWAVYNPIGNQDPTLSTNLEVARGFIVEVATAGDLVFNNSMRVDGNVAARSQEKNRFWLSAKNENGIGNSILVGYVAGATNELDAAYDAKPYQQTQLIYSKLENDYLAIQGRAEEVALDDVVNLSLQPTIAGQYTIELSKVEGMFANGERTIYLKDRLTNTIVNLSENRTYSFIADAGVIDNRFEIVYQERTLGLTDAVKGATVVYKDNGAIAIQSNQVINSVKVYDVTGRLIQTVQNINQTNVKVASKVKASFVVVSVELKDGTVVNQKVIL